MFAALGRFTYRRRWYVILAFALVTPFAAFYGQPALSMLKFGGFENFDAESWRTRDLLAEKLGVGAADIMALYTTPTGNVDEVEVLGGIMAMQSRVEQDPDVVRVVSYYGTGANQLVSRDRTRTFVIITLRGDENHKGIVLERLRPLLQVEGLDTKLAGFIPTNQSLFKTVEHDMKVAELWAFPITAGLLILIFGSLASAALPLMLGGLSIVLAFAALRAILLFSDVSIFAANVVTGLGLGLAIDYSLFLINRYREELPLLGVEGAVVKAVSTTGRAVAFSGVTVAASMVGLFMFPQMFLRSLGLGGLAVTLGAVLLALTLLPAVLAVLGTRIDAFRVPFAPRQRGADEDDDETAFWHRIAFIVMKRPVLTAVAVGVPLIVLGLPFLRFHPSIPDYKVLPPGIEAREASAILDAEFLPHQVTPHDVVVHVEGDAMAPGNLAKLAIVSDDLAKVPGVSRVEGVFTLASNVSRAEMLRILGRSPAAQDPVVAGAISAYARNGYMRFSVVSEEVFNDKASLDSVRAIRAMPLPEGVQLQIGGASAYLYDFLVDMRERTPWMLAIVFTAMFFVLFLVFGSITLPIKAMIMNSLSLTASFGAIVWVFQDGRFQKLLHYKSLGITDASQPIVMFAIVFGLSMDYEVLLLSRVREEYVRTGDNTLSVARGLARTGRLITSAAALLVVVNGAFATSDIVIMKTLGVGMALAIALDATIVRALLVPATMRLMGDWNWYAPKPMLAFWERMGMSDLEGHGAEREEQSFHDVVTDPSMEAHRPPPASLEAQPALLDVDAVPDLRPSRGPASPSS